MEKLIDVHFDLRLESQNLREKKRISQNLVSLKCLRNKNELTGK